MLGAGQSPDFEANEDHISSVKHKQGFLLSGWIAPIMIMLLVHPGSSIDIESIAAVHIARFPIGFLQAAATLRG